MIQVSGVIHRDILLLVDVDEVKVLLEKYKLDTRSSLSVFKGVAFKMEIKAMATFLMMKGGGSTEKLVGANPDAIKENAQIIMNYSGKMYVDDAHDFSLIKTIIKHLCMV